MTSDSEDQLKADVRRYYAPRKVKNFGDKSDEDTIEIPSVKQDNSSPKAQSEAPSVHKEKNANNDVPSGDRFPCTDNDIIAHILSDFRKATLNNALSDVPQEEAVAKINRLIVQARFDEINKVDDVMENEAKQPDEHSTAMYVSQRLYELEQLSNNLSKGDGDE